MLSILCLVYLLFLADSTTAGPVGRDGQAHDLGGRQYTTWTPPAYCTSNSAANAMKSASKSFDYGDFCYWYMQPTYEVFVVSSSSVVGTTLTSTYQTYTTTSTTSTNYATSTVTALCATPSTSMTCGLPASGNADNQLSADWDPTDGYTCQQSCLANPLCKSFQTVPEDNGAMKWLICNLYNADVNSTAFPMSGTGTMWDRDCPDFMPGGCKESSVSSVPTITGISTSTITAAPRSLSLDHTLQERQQSIPYPSFLSIAEENIYFGCLCITTPAPTITQTVTLVVPIYSETTISQTFTEIDTKTSAPNFITTYTTVPS